VQEMEDPALLGWWPSRGRRAGGGRKTTASCCGQEPRHRARQVWITKASASEPLMKRRKQIGGIETGGAFGPRDEPGGCLLTGQAVSGVEVARAWSGLLCGTCEPVVPRPRAASGAASAHGRLWKRVLQAAEPRGAE